MYRSGIKLKMERTVTDYRKNKVRDIIASIQFLKDCLVADGDANDLLSLEIAQTQMKNYLEKLEKKSD